MYRDGWIKLHKKFESWEWFRKSEMVHLFIYLLLRANHKTERFEGHEIKRGSLVTGRLSISENTGISEQSVRTCLKRLKSTNEITIKSTNRFSIISICNYDTYQITDNINNQQTNQVSAQQLTNNQPTTNHNRRSKEVKKERIKETYKEKSDEFWEAFEAFEEMRIKIKEPLTDKAIKMAITKLDRLSKKESDQIEMLNESTMSNWKGLFPTDKMKAKMNNQSNFKGEA